MSTLSQKEITGLLLDWGSGDKAALDKLIPLVYKELRRMAHQYMRHERKGDTFQTSALINEAYIRLVDYKKMRWQDRAHFFGMAAQLMRRILVDFARARDAGKRRALEVAVPLDEADATSAERSADLVALDTALTRLSELHPRHGRVVELRFFGGLTLEEVAEVLGVSMGTVRRDWSLAKAWLYRELRSPGDHP
jgi:RNA polymerase sigma factor (TIGR02999 family)